MTASAEPTPVPLSDGDDPALDLEAAACAKTCGRPIRWKVLTTRGDRWSCAIHLNAVVNELGAHRAEIVSTNPFTEETS